MRSEPESFRARTLSASLTVKDLAKSLAWYHDVVGFSVEREHRREGTLRAISLSAGDVRILINLDDGAKGWDRAKGEGFSRSNRSPPTCLGGRACSGCATRTGSS